MTRNVLELEGISKRFGNLAAVNDISLIIRQGEIFTLLGPSGCGKTTTLRLIAGLEHPDSGRISLAGRIIVDVRQRIFTPPDKRNMGMVFQSYAIWPHKSVFENIAYPLRVRGLRGREVEQRVGRVLETVGLAGFEKRRGPELSGGQQQRVALARALVYQPDILLLDEPFSNLDAQLREQMRRQLKALLRQIDVSVVLVTHDQVEALSLSDRVALMHKGAVVQTGKPPEIYSAPAAPFVRDFFGRTSLLPGSVREIVGDGLAITVAGLNGTALQVRGAECARFAHGQNIVISIRPEDVEVRKTSPMPGELSGVIESALFLGERYECCIRIGEGRSVFAYVSPAHSWVEGETVSLQIAQDRINLWPA
jgi:ABC-type Fe3+/spermidine/putrescine transport system ATPase subunit